MLRINDDIEIEAWELSEQFVRASGAGGQHVNKVSTAVELRFEAARSPNLPNFAKIRLKKIAGQKWTQDGAIIIFVQTTRSQLKNREIAKERLVELIQKALIKPKYRKATKPTYASKLKRLDKKKQRGEVKRGRGKISFD